MNPHAQCKLINYWLKSEVAIKLHFHLCSAQFTELQRKNSRRSTSAITPVTTENMDREAIELP